MSTCQIPHPSRHLAIVCKCTEAKCVPCLDQYLMDKIDEEDLSWNICPQCKEPFNKLRIYYTHRLMSEWANYNITKILALMGLRCHKLVPSSYSAFHPLILLMEHHFYLIYSLFFLITAICYSDYFLVGIALPNMQYLIHRHFRRYDHVIYARFDPKGTREEAISWIMLQFDLFTVGSTVVICAVLLIWRLYQTTFMVELMTYANLIYIN